MKKFFITTFFTIFLVVLSPLLMLLFTNYVSNYIELPKNNLTTTFQSYKQNLPSGVLPSQSAPVTVPAQNDSEQNNQPNSKQNSSQNSSQQKTNSIESSGQKINVDISDPKVYGAIIQLLFLVALSAFLAPLWEEISFRLMLGKNPRFSPLKFKLSKFSIFKSVEDKTDNSGETVREQNSLIQSEIIYKIGIFSFLVFIGKIIFEISAFSIKNSWFFEIFSTRIDFQDVLWLAYLIVLAGIIFYFLDGKDWRRLQFLHSQNQTLVYFVTTLIFALVHTLNFSFENFNFVYLLFTFPQFISGMAFGFFRVRYGFGWGVWSHCLHNFCLILLFLLAPGTY